MINIATIHMPRMLVEDNDENSRACMVSFYPEFNTQPDPNPTVHLLFDASNSMNIGETASNARKLALLMLNHLPKKCRFNIVLFGSDFIELFPNVLENNPENLNKAVKFLLENKKPRGNTDLLNLIQPYLVMSQNIGNKGPEHDFDKINNFVLISDGHLTRPQELLSMLHGSKDSLVVNRVFTCSIGDSADNQLLKVIANVTGGSYDVFESKCQFKWKEKIEDIMDKIVQPAAIKNIKIEWQNQKTAQEKTDENTDLNVKINFKRIL